MKTVLITGAGSGLGKATADLFLKKGYQVVATDKVFSQTSDERPGKALLRLSLDVSSAASVDQARRILQNAGISIDILINNAGIFELYPLCENDTLHLERALGINTLGAVRMVRAFLPDLMVNRGRVLQISSESVKFPGMFQPYQVSKMALEAYSRSVRQELLLKGVRLTIIRPGAIQTNLYGELSSYTNPVEDSAFHEEFRRFTANTGRFIGRVLKPEQVSRVIYRAATARRPRYIYRINHNPILTILSKLPDRWIDYLVVQWMKK